MTTHRLVLVASLLTVAIFLVFAYLDSQAPCQVRPETALTEPACTPQGSDED